MTRCKLCNDTGLMLVPGPCEGAEQDAPCVCITIARLP